MNPRNGKNIGNIQCLYLVEGICLRIYPKTLLFMIEKLEYSNDTSYTTVPLAWVRVMPGENVPSPSFTYLAHDRRGSYL